MEHLNFRESVLNCPICHNSGNRRQTHFSKHYMKEFNRRMHKCMQDSAITADESHENLNRNRSIMQKYMSYKDGYEQIYRKSLLADVKEAKKCNQKKEKHHHTNMPAIIYQVYTLTTDNNKPKKKSSRTVYSYPYSSSGSDSSQSFIGKKKKKPITMHPSTKSAKNTKSTKKGSDDETDDSEFNTCKKFPITEKHYRHIVDGVECSSHHKKPSTIPKKKSKEEKARVSKRVDVDFNQSNQSIQSTLKQSKASKLHACALKAKKKCNCKSKCKHKLEEERSDSILSEKTFTKFINSLHSYVNKTRTFNNHKYQRKVLDSDSSCSLCKREEKQIKKKKSNKDKERDAKKQEHQHHHNHNHNQNQHNHQSSHHRTVTEDTNE